MRRSELRRETVELVKTWRFDRIIEKHEGPFNWSSFFEHAPADLVEVEGRHVLLPIYQDQYDNITILRSYVSPDESSMTIFLKDVTLEQYFGKDNESLYAGFIAVCDRVPGDNIYVAVVYHEWFIVDNRAPSG